MIILKKVLVKAPARVDFAGGWTDNGVYPFEKPAAVLNAGINCLGIKISIKTAQKFQTNQDSELLRVCLKFLKLENPAIKIEIKNSIPRGSGLGGSGLLIYGILAGILSYYDKPIDKIQLMNSVIEVEKMLGSCGGWNDTSALINPGITFTQTSPDKPGQYKMQNMLNPELSNLCLLINTGVSRSSVDFNIIKKGYERGDKETIKALRYARRVALGCWDLILRRDYVRCAELMAKAWHKICQLEPAMHIKEVGEIENIIGQDLAGGKLCGAGGGGFYLAILKDAENCEKVIGRLERKFQVYKSRFNRCLQIKKS